MATLPALPEISQPAIAPAAENASNLRPQFACISSGHGAISCTIDTQDCERISENETGERVNVYGGFRGVEDGAGRGSRTLTRGKPRRILSPVRSASNALKSKDLQDKIGVASTPVSTLSPENASDSVHKDTSATPDAETILVAIRAMSDAERGKLLVALLGLADVHK